jgi:hypothetical protein
MPYNELVVQLQAEVRKGGIDRGEAIDRLHQYADGGLTWQGCRGPLRWPAARSRRPGQRHPVNTTCRAARRTRARTIGDPAE